MQNTFHREGEKDLGTSVWKYWYLFLLFFFFFLDVLLIVHLSFPFWLISSWTGSWQSAPYVWTIHNPSEELHNRSHPLPTGEWEITLSIQFLLVFGAVKWCLTRYGSLRSHPPLLHSPPELALWLTKRTPGEEGVPKDTAKSGCGTSQFVIIVRFKCFCKNVVNLPTLLQSLGALGWYKYSAHPL